MIVQMIIVNYQKFKRFRPLYSAILPREGENISTKPKVIKKNKKESFPYCQSWDCRNDVGSTLMSVVQASQPLLGGHNWRRLQMLQRNSSVCKAGKIEIMIEITPWWFGGPPECTEEYIQAIFQKRIHSFQSLPNSSYIDCMGQVSSSNTPIGKSPQLAR